MSKVCTTASRPKSIVGAEGEEDGEGPAIFAGADPNAVAGVVGDGNEVGGTGFGVDELVWNPLGRI